VFCGLESALASGRSRPRAAASANAGRMLSRVTLADLTIEDEAAFLKLALYPRLKAVLESSGYEFRVPAEGESLSWDRAALLNLTFWNANDASDVLTDRSIPADVVTHAAWHHLARKALPTEPSADALFFGEAIASAFDLYLVGALLRTSPGCSFLETQVPLMAEASERAGQSEDDFEALLGWVAKRPERAFEQLRALLFDASTALVAARSVDDAQAALEALSSSRFSPILHHYELSNWALYARAYAPGALGPSEPVRALDRAMRDADDSLEWLERSWLT